MKAKRNVLLSVLGASLLALLIWGLGRDPALASLVSEIQEERSSRAMEDLTIDRSTVVEDELRQRSVSSPLSPPAFRPNLEKTPWAEKNLGPLKSIDVTQRVLESKVRSMQAQLDERLAGGHAEQPRDHLEIAKLELEIHEGELCIERLQTGQYTLVKRGTSEPKLSPMRFLKLAVNQGQTGSVDGEVYFVFQPGFYAQYDRLVRIHEDMRKFCLEDLAIIFNGLEEAERRALATGGWYERSEFRGLWVSLAYDASSAQVRVQYDRIQGWR